MDLKIEDIKKQLEWDLAASKEIQKLSERLPVALTAIDNAVLTLKRFIDQHSFQDSFEEIDFFKSIKPKILALRIEEVMYYNLVINKPIATNEIQLNYYVEELKALEGFFRSNAFHFQYYRNGITEMDALYFLRSAGRLPVPMPVVVEIDHGFSTPMSYLFAKFIAYEHVQYFILEQIAALKYPELDRLQKTNGNTEDLIWTGDVINIIELAYGLWLTGQLNHGNASLNQIVRRLEKYLKVSIGIAQRKFTEITRRKRISITKFIDQMRDAILKKIDNDNG